MPLLLQHCTVELGIGVGEDLDRVAVWSADNNQPRRPSCFRTVFLADAGSLGLIYCLYGLPKGKMLHLLVVQPAVPFSKSS